MGQSVMPPVPIPAWNADGLIPPIDIANPASPNRAPYTVLLTDLVLRFSTSPERIAILRGYLGYRAELQAAGLTTGFQWLNGSFAENIETSSRNRAPNDIDVVTFYRLPAGLTQVDLVATHPDLFPSSLAAKDALKARLCVDAFTVDLSTTSERLINRSSYWYGLWSHQRASFKWKGFLQVDLAPVNDAAALQLLAPPNPTIAP